MRFILSRKGYDSQFGGCPSPVFKSSGKALDGFMYSIPVPERDSKGNSFDYKRYSVNYPHYLPLTPVGFPVNTRYFHLDPDIRPELHRELPQNWCPILGQSDAAAQHLKNQHVDNGDIFLFFGLFQDVEWNENYNQWIYGESEPYHAIWGYMQIKEIIYNVNENDCKKYPWHPHCQPDYHSGINNTLYIGNADNLNFDNEELKKFKGYGTFKYDNNLKLTIDEKNVSPNEKNELTKMDVENESPKEKDNYLTHWSLECLPWLDPQKKKAHMSYHSEKYFHDGIFQAASRGQEFVTDDFDNEPVILEKVLNWFKDLVKLRTDFPRKLLQ